MHSRCHLAAYTSLVSRVAALRTVTQAVDISLVTGHYQHLEILSQEQLSANQAL